MKIKEEKERGGEKREEGRIGGEERKVGEGRGEEEREERRRGKKNGRSGGERKRDHCCPPLTTEKVVPEWWVMGSELSSPSWG